MSLDALLKSSLHPIEGGAGDYDPLMRLIGERHFMLLGEASHGTHDFYRERAEITKRLIVEKGFNAVAVEADWPDAYRINRFVRGEVDGSAEEALSGFKRFPTWMWRNRDVLEFIAWLRGHNDTLPPLQRVGFYGLDLYSLFTSIAAVLDYLDQIDPSAARRARYRYGCLEHFGEEPQQYGYAASFDVSASCEEEVVRQLLDLRQMAGKIMLADAHTGPSAAADEFFYTEQNARLVKNAEEYYRSMFKRRVSSWNLRDRHMAETLAHLVDYLPSRSGNPTRVAVWEHNSHLGDARATEMGWSGELNVGQLVREAYGDDAVLVGFTTFAGTVAAASGWDQPVEFKRVREALPGSVELLFHETGVARFLLPMRGNRALEALREPLLERAIGVIYLPQTERSSHYFRTRLYDQFDAVLHFDRTTAVEPLDRTSERSTEPPETFPSGI